MLGVSMFSVAGPALADGAWILDSGSPGIMQGPLWALESSTGSPILAGGGSTWRFVAGPGASWMRLPDAGTQPSIFRSAFIYDPVRSRLVTFGGGFSGTPSNLTHVFTLTAPRAWSELAVSGTPPSPRTEASGIYDPVRDRLIVFGGINAGTRNNEVHALDLATNSWSPIATSGTPPTPRAQHAAIYDAPRDRMLVFGGSDPTTFSRQLWSLSLGGTPTWTLLSPTGQVLPSTNNVAAIYDPVRDRMVILDCRLSSNHVWAVSLSSLFTTRPSIPGPQPPAGEYRAVYAPLLDQIQMFGGVDDGVWSLSLSGTLAWSHDLLPRPGKGGDHTAVVDPTRQRMLVYGVPGGGVWAYSTAGVARWTQIHPTGPPGAFFTAIADPVRDRMLVFGGSFGTPTNDLWEFALDGSGWTLLAPTGTPPSARSNHAAILDPLRDRMLVFGGYPTDVQTYALDLATDSWSVLTAAGTPSTQIQHSAIYDPVRDRMLVCGGNCSGPEVLALSLTGTPTWTSIATAGTPPYPQTGCNSAAAYDAVRDRLIVFGGGSEYESNALHALSLAGTPTWTTLTPPGESPGGWGGSSLVYDVAHDRMILHGGIWHGGLNNTERSNWTYSLWWGNPLGAPAPGPPGLAMTVRPNPARGFVSFDLPSSEIPTTLEVIDVGGRRVWAVTVEGSLEGKTLEWNRRTLGGDAAPPGVYFTRCSSGRRTSVLRFVLID